MAKSTRKPLLNPTSEQAQAYIPAGHRPKNTNGTTRRERHCYGFEVQNDQGTWDELAHGLTASAAEACRHAWGCAHDYQDVVVRPNRITDLGTVSQYRIARGLDTVEE